MSIIQRGVSSHAIRSGVSTVMRVTSMASGKIGIGQMASKDQVIENASRAVKKGLDSRITSIGYKASNTGLGEEQEHLLSGEDQIKRATTGPALTGLIKFTQTTLNTQMKKQGCDKHMLMKVVLEDEWQYRTCTSLPLTVLFFGLFVLCFQLHYSTSYINLQESALRVTLTNSAEHCSTPAQVFAWMNNTFFPFVWAMPNVPGSDRSGQLGPAQHQKLMGGVLMYTARGPSDNCTEVIFNDRPCYSSFKQQHDGDPVFNGWEGTVRRLTPEPEGEGWATWAARAVAPRRLDQIGPEVRLSIADPANKYMGYRKVIPMSMPISEIRENLARWSSPDMPLITPTTVVFGVQATVRNEQIGPGLVTTAWIYFQFSRGGAIYTSVELQTNILKTPMAGLATLGAWAVLLVGFTFFTPFRALSAARAGRGCSYFSRPANVFEWMLVIVGWIILVIFVLERVCMGRYQNYWNMYMDGRQSTTPLSVREYDQSWYWKLYAVVDLMGGLDNNLVVFVADYHIILLFRFLIASRGHPRLAITINTMNEGMVDLFHLFLVFGLILAAYVMAGHILMGHRLEWFATIHGSFGYIVSVVLQRQYDWGPIASKDTITVGIWVWTFMIIEVQVVINIVLAMIFDNYGAVRLHVTEKDTLWHTTRHLVTQLRLLSTWVSNHDLLTALSKCGKSESVNADRFRAMLPGISNEQLSHLFEAAKMRLFTTVLNSNKNLLPEAIASILIAIDEMRHGVRLIMNPPRPSDETERLLSMTEARGREETGPDETQGLDEFPEELDGPGRYEITHHNAAVRTRLELSSTLVQHLEAGTMVDVLLVVPYTEGDVSRLRARIEAPDGWISLGDPTSGYRFAKRRPEPEKPPPTEDKPGEYTVTHNNAAVRSTIELSSPIIEHLEVGTVITVLEVAPHAERELQRIRARIESPVGWISLIDPVSGHRFAERNPEPEPKVLEEDAPGKYTIVHNNAAVRSQLDMSSPIVKHLLAGTVVKVFEVVPHGEGDLARIRARIDNPAGWISLTDIATGYRFADRIPTPDKDWPDGAPLWLKTGLGDHLHRQRRLMDRMHFQLKAVEKELAQRGLVAGRFPFPSPQPPPPPVNPSADPEYRGPVSLSASEGRPRQVVHEPRPTQAPSSSVMAERPGKAGAPR